MTAERVVDELDGMVAYQKNRKAGVAAAVSKALLEMEAEIIAVGAQEAHAVKICRAEACRRAGVGESTLKNPSHADTIAFANRELARLKSLGKRGGTRKSIAADVGLRVDTYLGCFGEQFAALALGVSRRTRSRRLRHSRH